MPIRSSCTHSRRVGSIQGLILVELLVTLLIVGFLVTSLALPQGSAALARSARQVTRLIEHAVLAADLREEDVRIQVYPDALLALAQDDTVLLRYSPAAPAHFVDTPLALSISPSLWCTPRTMRIGVEMELCAVTVSLRCRVQSNCGEA
ncbi:MAG: hypothetical protein QY326_04675 [Bdellovibrionota bacterium]|nr:MAG: hypothetical protein QY326_04675 [Bdellovibrionota bacterium]